MIQKILNETKDHIILDYIETWPNELVAYLEGKLNNNEYTINIENSINDIKQILHQTKFIGFHCTRLTDEEIMNIKAKGLNLKRSELLANRIDFLKKNDFNIFPRKYAKNINEIFTIANEFKLQRSEFNFPVDGVVIKQYKVLFSDMDKTRPDAQRAYKWEDEGVETTLREIEWSRSGTTYTPIAIFDSILIEGSTVSRASLANESLIHDLDLAIGDKILVTKRNMIIPKIEEVLERPETRTEIQYPEYCTCCGEKLTRDDKKLYCSNLDCSGRSEHQIAKWLGIMNTKGFGISLQEHLFNTGIHEIIDLYDDEKVAYSKSQTNLKENFTKAFKSLYSVKEIPTASFLGGFDIDGLGRRMFESVIASGYNDVYDIMQLTHIEREEIKIANMGNERISQLQKGLEENKEKMLKLILKLHTKNIELIENIKDVSLDGHQLSGQQVCVTGKLNKMTRKEINNFIILHGGIVASGVNKNTSILVTNDALSGSSKTKAAEKFGTRVISEEDLYNLCS